MTERIAAHLPWLDCGQPAADEREVVRGQALAELRWRAQAALHRARALVDANTQLMRRLEQTRARPSRDELLQASPYARMAARLETMPRIEQAKGIIIAQTGCSPAEAFDRLRQASQRLNVPVRDLAARIVAKAAEDACTPARGTSACPPRNATAPLSSAARLR